MWQSNKSSASESHASPADGGGKDALPKLIGSTMEEGALLPSSRLEICVGLAHD